MTGNNTPAPWPQGYNGLRLALLYLSGSTAGACCPQQSLLRNMPLIAFFPTPDSAPLFLGVLLMDYPHNYLHSSHLLRLCFWGKPTEDPASATTEDAVRPLADWADASPRSERYAGASALRLHLFHVHGLQSREVVWFSTRGQFCPSGHIWPHPEPFLVITTGDECYGHLGPGMLLNIPQGIGQAPTIPSPRHPPQVSGVPRIRNPGLV